MGSCQNFSDQILTDSLFKIFELGLNLFFNLHIRGDDGGPLKAKYLAYTLQ